MLVQEGGTLIVAVAPSAGLIPLPADGHKALDLRRGEIVTGGAVSNFSDQAAILFSNHGDATVLGGGDVAVIIFGGDDEDDEGDEDDDDQETGPLDQFFPPLWSPHALRQFWIYVPIIRF